MEYSRHRPYEELRPLENMSSIVLETSSPYSSTLVDEMTRIRLMALPRGSRPGKVWGSGANVSSGTKHP